MRLPRIALALSLSKGAGHPPDQQTASGLWEWGVRWPALSDAR